MEVSENQKIYEFSYHLTPDLDESQVKSSSQEVADFITSLGGAVGNTREPRQVRLSYPIQKKRSAYLGTLNFSASPDSIEKLNNWIKLRSDILRYILVNRPDDKNLRVLGEYRPRHRARVVTHDKKEMPAPKEKAAESKEQLEKEVEQVIEKLK